MSFNKKPIYRKLLSKLRHEICNIVILSLALLIAFVWMVGAAYYKIEDTAGRGGAIAVAISFAWLFIGGTLRKEVYDQLKKIPGPNAELTELTARVGSLGAHQVSVQHHSWYLVVSSVIGTLIWGFGDLVAKYLIPTYLISKFGILVALSFELLPRPPVTSTSETKLLREKLIDFENLDEIRWKNLSGQIEELRRGRDTIQRSLDEISHRLQSVEMSMQSVQKAFDQAVAAPQASSKEATNQEPNLSHPTRQTYSVSFDVGQVGLNLAARRIIAQAAKDAATTKSVLCNGYPDMSGNLAVNSRISIQRATNVAVELIHDGVAANKITIKNYDQQHAGRVVGIVIQ